MGIPPTLDSTIADLMCAVECHIVTRGGKRIAGSGLVNYAAHELRRQAAEIERLRSALRVAEGALMECSPCANPECQAVQREWLAESIAGCRRALGA